MTHLSDQTSQDGKFVLDEVQSRYDLPANVVADGCATDPTTKYAAYPKAFPKSSVEQVVLSYAMLRGANRDADPTTIATVAHQLHKQAAYFGVTDALEAIDGIDQLIEKQAAEEVPTEQDFAWLDGQDRRLYIGDQHNAQRAADYLAKHAGEFNYQQRRTIAERILNRVEAGGFTLSDDAIDRLEKTAGLAIAPRDFVIRELNHNVSMAELMNINPEAANAMQQAIAFLKAGGAVEKAAMVLDAAQRVDQRILGGRPVEDVLFFLTRKQAAEAERHHIELSNGDIYERQAVAGCDLQPFRDRMGDDVADSLTKDGMAVDGELAADIMPTLPLPDAHTAAALLDAMGVRPIFKEAIEVPRLTKGVLEKLAAFAPAA